MSNDTMMELTVGKEYTVPCMVFGEHIIPIDPHIHSDVENGQEEEHYHLDDRFDYIRGGTHYPIGCPVRITPSKYPDHTIDYVPMVAVKKTIETHTPVEMIKESKLNMDNLKNDRCPHRGYDLSGVEPDENGVRKCPMHGLCTKGGKLTPEHELLFKQREFEKINDVIDSDVNVMLEHGIPFEQHFLYGKYKQLKEQIQRLKECTNHRN